jgi:hypothetical protein
MREDKLPMLKVELDYGTKLSVYPSRICYYKFNKKEAGFSMIAVIVFYRQRHLTSVQQVSR